MVTACATATVNNIPLLVFPVILLHPASLTPVLQQLEQATALPSVRTMHSNQSANTGIESQDRMVMTALINAMSSYRSG